MKNSTLDIFTKRISTILIVILVFLSTYNIAYSQTCDDGICDNAVDCSCAECMPYIYISSSAPSGNIIPLSVSDYQSNLVGKWYEKNDRGSFDNPNSLTANFTGTAGELYEFKYEITNSVCGNQIFTSNIIRVGIPGTPYSGGDYNVGTAGTFKSLKEAFELLSLNGIAGDVRLILTDATYEENPFSIGTINGNDLYKISLTTNGISSVNVNFTYVGGDNTCMFFENIRNFTIDGLAGKIKFTKQGFYELEAPIVSSSPMGGSYCSNVTIKNCIFDESNINNVVNSTSIDLMNMYNNISNIVIENNTFINTAKALRIFGVSNFILQNNIFENLTSEMDFSSVSNFSITGNTIRANTSGVINLSNCTSFEFSGNRINKPNGGTAINISNCGGAGLGAKIFNNSMVLSGSTYSSELYGINISNSSYLNITNNTIVLNNGWATCAVITDQSPGSNSNILINNNLVNFSSVETAYVLDLYSSGFCSSSGYNNMYSGGAFVARMDLENFSTTESLPALYNDHVMSFKPFFAPDSCHLTKLNSLIDNAGMNIPEITSDIDGKQRISSEFDLGASNFTTYPKIEGLISAQIPDNDTIVISDDVEIDPAYTLNIKSGTRFLVYDNSVVRKNIHFSVNGTLIIDGKNTDKVYFLSTSSSDNWGGIKFNQSANLSSLINYAVIEGADTGIFVNSVQGVTVSNSIIKCNTGISLLGAKSYIFNDSLNCNGPGADILVYAADNSIIEGCKIIHSSYSPIIECDNSTTQFLSNIFKNISSDSVGFNFIIHTVPSGGDLSFERNEFINTTYTRIYKSIKGNVRFRRNKFISPKDILSMGSGQVFFDNNVIFYPSTYAPFYTQFEIGRGDSAAQYVAPKLVFYNNTLLNKSNSSTTLFKLYGYQTNIATLVCANSIIWGMIPSTAGPYTNSYISYSVNSTLSGNNNLSVDPQFVKTDDNDFNLELKFASPCKNTGKPSITPDSVGNADFSGKSRFIGSAIDIGALEFTPFTAGTLTDSDICVGNIANYQVTSNKDYSITYQWQTSPDNITFTTISSQPEAAISNSTAGTIYLKCVLTNTLTLESCSTNVAQVRVYDKPVPVITGPTVANAYREATYKTDKGMSGYTWNVSGGTIISSNSNDSVIVKWGAAGSGTVSVNYSKFGCTAETPTTYSVTKQAIDITSGLVAWYPFNGNANDETGNGNDGTVTSGLLTSDRHNSPNSAYNMNVGSITCNTTPSVYIPGDITICSWLKVVDQVGMQTYVSKELSSNGWKLYISDIHGDLAFASMDGAYKMALYSYDLRDAQWHFIVAQRNGDAVRLFDNGVLVNENIYAGIGTTDNPGAILTLCTGITGYYDDIRIYNRALSFAEIDTLYQVENMPTINTLTCNDEDQIVCEGQNVTFTASPYGLSRYKFYINGALKQDSTINTFETTLNNNDIVKVTGISPVYSSGSAELGPFAVNMVGAESITGSNSVCKNSNDLPYSVPTGLMYYSWSATNGAITTSPIENNILVNWSNADTGKLQVMCMSTNGCSKTIKMDVVLRDKPVISPVSGSRCGNGTVNLSATSDGSISWYAESTGGTSFISGTSYSALSLSSSQTYYLEADNLGCKTDTRTPITATIKPVPVIQGTVPETICYNDSAVLTATSDIGVVNWYNNTGDVTPYSTGINFTTPKLTTSTTYYVDAELNGCRTTSKTPITATVNIPSITSTVPASICDSGTVTIKAYASSGVINWYSNSTGGTAIATGNSYTTLSPVTSSTSYYVDANDNGCASLTRTEVAITVNEVASVLTSKSDTLCGAGPATVEATVSAGTPAWYDMATGGTNVFNGNSYTISGATTTDTFYVAASANGCLSERTPVYVVVETLPSVAITKSADNVCPGTTVTLTASGSDSYVWLNGLGNGITKTVKPLITTSYTVTGTSANGCEATANTYVNVSPAISVDYISSDASYQNRGSITVNATGGSGNFSYLLNGGTSQKSNIFSSLDSGKYIVTVVDDQNCNASTQAIIDWSGPICNANFTYVTDSLGTVTFTNSSSGVNVYFWTFGDEQSSVLKNTTNKYSNAGLYHVCLSTYDSVTFCNSEICKDIIVPFKNKVTTYSNFTYVVSGDTVKFTNLSQNVTNYYWTFGDGSFSILSSPAEKIYKKSGLYNVCLKVFNTATGATNSSCQSIIVGQDACTTKASFSYVIKDSVRFANMSTGQYDKYFWNFGDGATSTESNPSHKYAKEGYYMVNFSVMKSGSQCLDTYTEFIKIGSTACKADFDYVIDATNDSVTFINKSTAVNAVYYWNFGDGGYSLFESPRYKFKKEGLNFVTLTVANGTKTCMDYASKQLQVGEAKCGAHFTYFIDTDNTAIFRNDAIGESTNYLWDFGDGTFSNDTAPKHLYSFQGYYTVTLNTFNKNNGCMDSYTTPILAGSEDKDCEADFIYQVVSSSKTAYFKDISKGNIKSYTWDYGDGQPTGSGVNPSHQFRKSGYYNVCLSVVNIQDIPNITCKWIEVATDEKTNCYADFMFNVNKDKKEVSLVSNSIGNPNTFEWNFGDTKISNKKDSATHIYSDTGYYLISLHITTASGCESFGYKLINIGKPNKLYASFGYNAKHYNTKAGGYPVDFGGAGIGDNSRLRWNFGDGSENSTSMTPTHEYAEPGTYTVCLDYVDTITQQSVSTCNEVSTQDFCQDDTIKPVVKCKDTTIVVLSGYTDIPTKSVIESDSDDCAISMRSLDNARFYPQNEGDNTIHVTVTDYNNNKATCAAYVTVKTSNAVQMLNVTKGLKVYPNPVDKVAVIKYIIESSSDIELVLFDLSGKLVSTIYDGKQTGGQQSVNFDASLLMSGSYILQLKTSAGIVKRTMLVKK